MWHIIQARLATNPGRRNVSSLTRFLVVLSFAWTLPNLAQESQVPADWPCFRGPARDGVSRETGLLRTWGPEGPRELWRVPIGEGFSGIAVVGDRLYTTFAAEGFEYAAAFRVADGHQVWRKKLDKKFVDPWGNGPRATPTVADGIVYVVSALGQLVALATTDGREVWRFDYNQLGSIVEPFTVADLVPPEEEPNAGAFGHASSPVLVGEWLVTFPGALPNNTMAIFERRTGKLLWSGLSLGSSYSSPLAVTILGRPQVVQILAGAVVGLDPGTREILWQHPWPVLTTSQPVFVPPDRIFVATFNDVGGELFQVLPAADGASSPFRTQVLWKNPQMRSSWSSAIYFGDHLFGFDNATLRCLAVDKGELSWAKRGYGKGTVLVADGLLFVLTDHGVLHMGEASAQGFMPTGSVQVFAKGPTWTAPSVADGRMYLRNSFEMVALDLRASNPSVPEAQKGKP